MSGAGVAAGAAADRTGNWTLDPQASSITLTHKTAWGLVPVRGRFDRFRGHGRVDADGGVSGAIAVEAASIGTKNKKRDTHLRSPDFFNVAEHPSITFTLSGAVPAGPGALTLHGTLEAAGVSRPLTLRAEVADDGPVSLVLSSDVTVDRADFGMTLNMLGMVRGLAVLSIRATFTRDGG